MHRLPDQQHQARSYENVGNRKKLMLTSRRKLVFVSNALFKISTGIITITSLSIIVWEFLIVTKSRGLIHQQIHRNDMYSNGRAASLSVPTDNATTISTTGSVSQQNQLLYTGSFGIGHRMNKLSCLYHMLLANKSRSEFYKHVSVIKIEWGTCPTTSATQDKSNIDIFEYLFASQYIDMFHVHDLYYGTHSQGDNTLNSSILGKTTRADNQKKDLNLIGTKTLWIRNDVAGYYAGQSYKNAQIRLTHNIVRDFLGTKLLSDNQLFRYLIEHRFIGYNHVQQYKIEHEWDKHYVMGVHIRAGNGEQNHFVQSGRNMGLGDVGEHTRHDERIVQSIARSIQHLYSNAKREQSISVKPPLVFLATDTEHYIKALTKALKSYNIPLITFNEQPRIPKGMGVSYDNAIYLQQSNISCYQSWYGSMIDMTLLSESSTVIATTRSTFTQILPNSIVFHRAGSKNSYKYCEMDLTSNQNNTKVTCFRSQTSWLLRNNSSEWSTFCVNGNNEDLVDRGCIDSSAENGSHPVTHKLMVHFPDIDDHDSKHRKTYSDAIAFLQQQQPLLPNETIYYYGRKYNSKYRVRRKKEKSETVQSNWTWEE